MICYNFPTYAKNIIHGYIYFFTPGFESNRRQFKRWKLLGQMQ